ncbi:uncharacterized protein LOC110691295 [Chenopodium quinoa]|uniref:uncharacterized protein LOC110691295 n=1 Tax=Chenopodium quinoa TaxID=63459 RepID=UPI000B76C670|nr:uncharacterized protein LOC110691295 [Chenopodium quinoa]
MKFHFNNSRVELKGVPSKKLKVIQDGPSTKLLDNAAQGYASISKPLTDLLKKGAFEWCDAAQQALEALKIALVTTPVLAIPDFSKQSLGPKWQKLSIHEKELLAMVFAVQK